MEAAKEHVGKFLHGSGKHTAELHSHTNEPVTHETVSPTRQENVRTAIDREVHEEHHQTEVLPVHDREVKSTEHHHNVVPVEKRHQHHGHDSQVKEKLGAIAGAFEHKHHVEEAQHVKGEENTLVGEHHHHHIHHTVQPVVKKETIQPHVVHTTVPVHEKVDLEPTVHSATVAKPMSMDQFKQHMGVGGHADQHEKLNYSGDPLSINKDADVGFLHGGGHAHPGQRDQTSTGMTSHPTSGAHGSNISGTQGMTDTGLTSGNTGDVGGTNAGLSRGANDRELQGDNRHHGGAGVASAGAAAAAMSAAHHHRDRDNTHGTGATGLTGRGNEYAPTGAGQTRVTGGGLGAEGASTAGRGNDYGSTGLGQNRPGETLGMGGAGTAGRGNDYAPYEREGETIGSTAAALGHRDKEPGHHHHSTTDHKAGGIAGTNAVDPRSTDTRDVTGMPGAYVHDTADEPRTSDTVPRTVGQDAHHGQSGSTLPKTAQETGFIDGRSPNDNKPVKEEKSGGLISGLINKMKS